MSKTTSIVGLTRVYLIFVLVYMLTFSLKHWHGIFQEGTNWADGPAFVTQCPIASGNSFLYDFHVPDQAGRPLPFRPA